LNVITSSSLGKRLFECPGNATGAAAMSSVSLGRGADAGNSRPKNEAG
jgi:hypothetical protein